MNINRDCQASLYQLSDIITTRKKII